MIRPFSRVEIHSGRIRRLYELVQEIKYEKGPVTVVCGDNQQSLIVGLFLKYHFKNLIRIQIQFHGDTYSWISAKSLQGVVRVLLSRLGIVFADSIRLVSIFQFREVGEISNFANSKFVLAPIPIDFSRVAKSPMVVKFDVVSIGRLHSERGVSEFLEIVKMLKNVTPGIRIAVVGDGPLRKRVEGELSKWLVDSTVTMTGFLTASEIYKVYASSKILLSCAAGEGYGLTLREAVLSNVSVVAKESEGSLEANECYPERIDLYQSKQQAVELILRRLIEPRLKNLPQIIEAQSKRDIEGLNRLIDSWLIN
jgi:glycosyltransferase involved in cell wall biosynthesis